MLSGSRRVTILRAILKPKLVPQLNVHFWDGGSWEELEFIFGHWLRGSTLCLCTCAGLVEQFRQVDHAPLERWDPLDNELWLGGTTSTCTSSSSSSLHVHAHLVHVHLVLHALLQRGQRSERTCPFPTPLHPAAAVCWLVSHLQQQHELRVVDVDGNVERRLVELAECVDVGAVLQQRLRHRLVAVLRRPVQRCHLQHVFGVDVGATLRKEREEEGESSSWLDLEQG